MTLKTLIKQSLEHLDKGDPRSALPLTEEAKSLAPENYKAVFLNGLTLLLMGRYEEAMRDLQTALPLKPDDPDIHTYLGRCFMALGDDANTLKHFHESARLRTETITASQSDLSIPAFRFKHDLQQLEALKQERHLDNRASESLAAFQTVWSDAGADAQTIGVPRSSAHFKPVSYFYETQIHSEPGSKVAGGALNPDLDYEGLSDAYLQSTPQIVVIDNFLSPAALQGLRDHSRYSTMWHRDMANGYLATTLEEDFACPLIFQIADELKTHLPNIMLDHRLSYAWAFKYDSTLNGVPMHADDAVVNVNFWITEDEANQSPETGGLILWNKKPPADWDFEAYNAVDSVEKIRDFLHRENAQGIRIPHRANRAVIFDSDLFHETDQIDFKDDYLSRRVNITYLYGVCRSAR